MERGIGRDRRRWGGGLGPIRNRYPRILTVFLELKLLSKLLDPSVCLYFRPALLKDDQFYILASFFGSSYVSLPLTEAKDTTNISFR